MQGRDKHFLSLLHTLEYYCNQLPGYDEHCPGISPEFYRELVCQRCGKYFPTKVFMKKHVKAMHSNKKMTVARVIQKDSQSIISAERSHGIVGELTYNVDQSIDNETASTSGNKLVDDGGIKNSRPWKLRSSKSSN